MQSQVKSVVKKAKVRAGKAVFTKKQLHKFTSQRKKYNVSEEDNDSDGSKNAGQEEESDKEQGRTSPLTSCVGNVPSSNCIVFY